MTKHAVDTAALAAQLAEAGARPGQPEALYRRSDRIVGETLGHRLFTILAFRPQLGEVERMYSSRVEEYPLLGRKKMGPTPWGEIVLEAGRPWFGASAEDIRWAFPDHELILSLGCETCLNAPVRYDGHVLGVISALDAAGAYDEGDLALLVMLAPYLVPALMLSEPSFQET